MNYIKRTSWTLFMFLILQKNYSKVHRKYKNFLHSKPFMKCMQNVYHFVHTICMKQIVYIFCIQSILTFFIQFHALHFVVQGSWSRVNIKIKFLQMQIYWQPRLNPSAKMPTTLRSCLIHSSEFISYHVLTNIAFSNQCPRVRNRFRIIIEQKWFGSTRSPHQLVIELKLINFWLQLIVPSNFAKETVAQFAAVGQLVVPG